MRYGPGQIDIMQRALRNIRCAIDGVPLDTSLGIPDATGIPDAREPRSIDVLSEAPWSFTKPILRLVEPQTSLAEPAADGARHSSAGSSFADAPWEGGPAASSAQDTVPPQFDQDDRDGIVAATPTRSDAGGTATGFFHDSSWAGAATPSTASAPAANIRPPAAALEHTGEAAGFFSAGAWSGAQAPATAQVAKVAPAATLTPTIVQHDDDGAKEFFTASAWHRDISAPTTGPSIPPAQTSTQNSSAAATDFFMTSTWDGGTAAPAPEGSATTLAVAKPATNYSGAADTYFGGSSWDAQNGDHPAGDAAMATAFFAQACWTGRSVHIRVEAAPKAENGEARGLSGEDFANLATSTALATAQASSARTGTDGF